MTAVNAIRGKPKPWRSLETIDAMDAINRSYRHGDEKLTAYAKNIGAPAAELLAWVTRITPALKSKPYAICCWHHLCDLRKAGRQPPAVLPSDILRREQALSRAKALAEILPCWPNPPLPEPNWHLEIAQARRGPRECGGANGWTRDADGKARRTHGPHARRRHRDDDDDGD